MGKKEVKPRPGKNIEGGFETYSGYHESTQVNVLRKLPVERVIVALKRLRKVVETEKLTGYDDDTVGAKHTTCNWGLCNDTLKVWPDPQDHIFPYEQMSHGRVSVLDKLPGHCPMQVMDLHKDGNGCFWSCHFFQVSCARSREEYLELIDKKISELEKL
jgi:hypothetical protein